MEQQIGDKGNSEETQTLVTAEKWSMFSWIYPYLGFKTSSNTNQDTVPEEIRQDPYSLELYRAVLEDGTEYDRSVRINIVGNYGQGKTSLMKRIIGEKPDKVESTNAIDVENFYYKRTGDDNNFYHRQDAPDYSRIIRRLVTVFQSTKLSEDVVDQPEIETIRKPVFDRNEDNKTMSASANPFIHATNTPGITSERIHEENNEDSSDKKRSLLSEKEMWRFAMEVKKEHSSKSSDEMDISIDFWDFGGQFIFYATHTMFHSNRAIYLLVLDLTSNLDEIVVDQDFPKESHDRNGEYFVRFWINSIHSFVGSEDGSQPTVILVGTHKDKLKGNIDKKIDDFFDNIRNLFVGTRLLKHIHQVDFAVDNTLESDESVAALREAIICLGTCTSRAVEIPVRWIQLENSLKEKISRNIISLEMVERIDAANDYPLGNLEQLKLFFKFHHAKGTYIYFDEEPISEHVVLKPQYLIDAFKCIITSERFCRKDPEIIPLWKKLLNEGRLEQTLIDKQWSKDENRKYMEYKEIILAFLTKHNILTEATAYDEDTSRSSGLGWFVVPSLLRNYCSQAEI